MPETITFDHYQVLTREDGSVFELGRGAMGITYKAFDTNLRVNVALKVINATYLRREKARERFVREARAAAQLRHPNVASVFHLAMTGDTWFYAMEFVDGETVESLVKRVGPIDPSLALRITIQVARALAAATKHHLVHRDIKPANVMLVKEDEDYVVKVIDFGLAKSIKRDENEDLATLSMGGFIGTAHFASPEQLEEKEIDVRSDIYSLGVTLWYMLTGRAPFGGSIAQVMSQHLHRLPPLHQLENLPVQVQSVVGNMIEKDPFKRPQTPAALRLELEQALASLPGKEAATEHDFPTLIDETTRDDSERLRASKPAKKLLWVASLAGSALVALMIGLFFLRQPPKLSSAAESGPAPISSVVPELSSVPGQAAPNETATAAPNEARVPSAQTGDQEAELKKAIAEADNYQATGNLPQAIAGYVRAQKDFPGNNVGKIRLNLLLNKLQAGKTALKEEEFDRMREPLTEAAKLDVVPAMEILGVHLRKRDPQASFNWLCSAAAHGRASAMREVGLRYSNGAGVERDFVRAAQWFGFAVERGDTIAKTLLAECYLLGKGVAKNETKAIELLKQAVAANDPRAMDQLGNCYHKGIGVAQDDREAFRLYRQAANLNFLDSFGNLGVLYLTSAETDLGKDESARAKKAVGLFRDGASKSNAFCMFLYARCLEAGTGIEANLSVARDWYRRAAENGNRAAQDWCQEHNVAFNSNVLEPLVKTTP
jgi:serine/threonine protein kinase/TPR repeat protein